MEFRCAGALFSEFLILAFLFALLSLLLCCFFALFLFFPRWSSNRCFALFSGHQCFKNVELSHISFVKSLFYNVFRTSVLQKRRTVAHFGREIVVLQCFPDISVAKT